MYFDYQKVGAASFATKSVSLLELAINVITDWIPGVPDSMAFGFADLLSKIIKAEKGTIGQKWFIRSEAGNFEKQWKQTTSWLLGVAFTRHIIELEGYRWWAPVSAFTFPYSLRSVTCPYWMKYLGVANCYITPCRNAAVNLLPDYVLARGTKSKWEVSFAESKGTKNNLTGASMPPQFWLDQSKNAKFYWKGKLYTPTQNLLIVTRVNPNARLENTRQTKVRAWNNINEENQISEESLYPILVLHYYGVCKRIGLDANAKLIEANSFLRESTSRISAIRDIIQHSRKSTMHELTMELKTLQEEQNEIAEKIDVLKEQAELEAKTTETNYGQLGIGNSSFVYYGGLRRQDFVVGNQIIRVGLSQIGMDVVKWLQGRYPDFNISIFERLDEILPRQTDTDNERFSLRNDGVFGEIIS